jgi:hypothetical protein
MTAQILQETPFANGLAPKLQAVYARLLDAVNAFAEAKMRKAVPMRQLRRCKPRSRRTVARRLAARISYALAEQRIHRTAAELASSRVRYRIRAGDDHDLRIAR